jgi:hypothetical protein
MTRTWRGAGVLLLVCALAQASSSVAYAQEGPAAAPERVEVVQRELEAGGAAPERLGALYRELAVARAWAGEDAAARAAFIVTMALDPAFRLDPGEPVEVRSPYMEARGFWSLQAERLALSAQPSGDGRRLELGLVDPAELVARVVVRVRTHGAGRFVEHALPKGAQLSVPVGPDPAPSRGEYTLLLLDKYGNRLWQAGSEAEPLSWTRPTDTATAVGRGTLGTGASLPIAATNDLSVASLGLRRRRMQATAAAAFVAAAAAGAAAVIEHREREHLADAWNRGDCRGQGETRAELCSDERSSLKRAERMAIGFYAGSAAALALGAVLLIAAPSLAGREPNSGARPLACRLGGGLVGVDCTLRF